MVVSLCFYIIVYVFIKDGFCVLLRMHVYVCIKGGLPVCFYVYLCNVLTKGGLSVCVYVVMCMYEFTNGGLSAYFYVFMCRFSLRVVTPCVLFHICVYVFTKGGLSVHLRIGV